VVDALGRPTGVLTREGVLAAVRAGERSARVGALAQEPARSVPAQGDLTQAAAALNAGAARVFTVVDSEGRLVGLLTRQNVAELMMIRAAQPGWTLPHRG
jgi:stage IV sporulation protein FB